MKDSYCESSLLARQHERIEAPPYGTKKWRKYNAAFSKRELLPIWFDPETQWLATLTGKHGRQPIFTDTAIQACPARKAPIGPPLRQPTGMVASLLELAGLVWPVPDFST